jgi:hypothetical protein
MPKHVMVGVDEQQPVIPPVSDQQRSRQRATNADTLARLNSLKQRRASQQCATYRLRRRTSVTASMAHNDHRQQTNPGNND